MNDTAVLSSLDRDMALEIYHAMDAGAIAEKTPYGIRTVFRGLSSKNMDRFYAVLRDKSYGSKVRNAARSLLDASVNSETALRMPHGPSRDRAECRMRMNLEECRLALRILGIE